MISEKMSITGKMTATVFCLTKLGLMMFNALEKKYKDDYNNPEYKSAKDRICRKYSEIKRRPQKWWQRLFNIPGDLMISINHNIVTNEGDDLVADIMQETPVKTKVDNTNGKVTVGIGWTGTTPKTNETVNTPAGGIPTKGMEATYPKTKGAFGATDGNVTQYKTLYTAGLLTGDPVVDEAALGNHATPASGDLLAYAEVSPTATKGATDTLRIDWEITFLGA